MATTMIENSLVNPAHGAANSMGRERLVLASLFLTAGTMLATWWGRVSVLDSLDSRGLLAWLSTCWGWWLGVPIVWIFAFLLASAAVAAVLSAYGRGPLARWSWGILLVLTATVVALMVWYVAGLMVLSRELPLKSEYLGPLGLGMLAGITVWSSAPTPRALARLGAVTGPGGIVLSPGFVIGCGILGLGATMVLAVGQYAGSLPDEAKELALLRRLQREVVIGEGTNRMILHDGGRAVLRLDRMPLLGSPEAKYIIVTFFDYRHPASSVNHQALREARERYGEQMAVLPVVFPLDHMCNPRVSQDIAARYPNACDYARLSLAVWRADPSKFEDFHDFLLTPRTAAKVFITRDHSRLPTLTEARAKAIELVGVANLEQALADPWIDEELRRHVEAKGRQGDVSQDPNAEAWPLTFWYRPVFEDGLSATTHIFGGVRGYIYTGTELFELLEQFWDIKPVNTKVDVNDPLMQMLSK